MVDPKYDHFIGRKFVFFGTKTYARYFCKACAGIGNPPKAIPLNQVRGDEYAQFHTVPMPQLIVDGYDITPEGEFHWLIKAYKEIK